MPNDTAMGSDERIVLPNGSGNVNGNGAKAETEAVGQAFGGSEGARRGDVKEGGGITVQTELSVQSTEGDSSKEGLGHYGFPERKLYNQYNV